MSKRKRYIHPTALWIRKWKEITIVEDEDLMNKYPGSFEATIESDLLIHSDNNDSAFNYVIDFDRQMFSCDDIHCRFKKLDVLQRYYELEMELEQEPELEDEDKMVE